MKWEGHEQSRNVEDRRGTGSAGGMGLPRIGGRGVGIGTIVIAVLAGWIFGINPLTVLGLLSGGAPTEVVQAPQRAPAGQPGQAGPAPKDPAAQFVATVLRDTYLDFAMWTSLVSIMMWLLALAFSLAGAASMLARDETAPPEPVVAAQAQPVNVAQTMGELRRTVPAIRYQGFP